MTKTALRIKDKDISLDRYAGEWVAFVDGKVIAFSEDFKDLMTQAKKRGLEKKVSVFLVPRKGEGPYVLLIV